MIRVLPAVIVLAGAGTAQVQAQPGSVAWLIERSGEPRLALHLGSYDLDGRGIVALDPLTLFATEPTQDLVRGPAQLYVVQRDDGDWRTNAAMALVLDDAAPVCGASVGVLGVDTGLAAMASSADLRQLQTFADVLDGLDRDLYDALAPQLDDSTVAGFITLPQGTRIPVASSGYGDGGYGLFRLDGAHGRPVAFYVDFIGDRDDAWIEPAPCANV